MVYIGTLFLLPFNFFIPASCLKNAAFGFSGRVKNDRFLEEVSAVFKKDDYFIVVIYFLLNIYGLNSSLYFTK